MVNKEKCIRNKMKTKDNITFMKLGIKERELLLKCLDKDINNLKCCFCGEKLSYKNCCIMPPIRKNGNCTITCSSPLCISLYLNKLEEE